MRKVVVVAAVVLPVSKYRRPPKTTTVLREAGNIVAEGICARPQESERICIIAVVIGSGLFAVWAWCQIMYAMP